MRTLGNILWHIPFMGFLTAAVTFLIGGIISNHSNWCAHLDLDLFSCQNFY